LNLPDAWHVELLAPRQAAGLPDAEAAAERALESPLGGRRLADFKGARSAAVAVNDKTRPVPHAALLPPLLRRLEGLGLPPEAITLLIATGAHPPVGREEFPQVVPAGILRRYPVFSHDAGRWEVLVHMGVTERGTPAWVNRRFAEADLRVVVGNIEPHQFMGFSGGVKSAAIGLAGLPTISHNHALMFDPRARLGRFDDNPARQDVEEIGRLIRVDFALNVVLNQAKEIVEVLAGAPGAVMQRGIPLVRRLYQVPAAAPFDLVIASPGGHPKDINLYQAQKGLAHAALVTRDGGAVVLAAACPEGTGSQSYERWMEGLASYAAVFQRFEREGFQIGPHKAFLLARDAARLHVVLVTDMPPDLARRLLLTPAGGLDEALAMAMESLGGGDSLRVGVMPLANATVPVLALRAEGPPRAKAQG
jgi:nickel-dependent lactate racemase